MAGRKAQPIEVALLRGKKHFTKKEIEARQKNEQALKVKSDQVKAPSWLGEAATKEFERLTKELQTIDLVTNLDVNALAVYCDAYQDYIQCCDIIEQEGFLTEHTNKAGETNRISHPLLGKKRQIHEQMKSLAVEFGFTPASRAKIAISKEEKPALSEFDQLFGGV